MTVPVIGPITATTIVAEVGDFTRFKRAKQLASYAGLVPSQRSSAGKTRHGRITKVGSKYLRTAFVESAMRLRLAHDTHLYTWYEQVRSVSSPMKARVALARKLACCTWYMMRNNEPFRSSKDITKRGDSERTF
jgi:transposase